MPNKKHNEAVNVHCGTMTFYKYRRIKSEPRSTFLQGEKKCFKMEEYYGENLFMVSYIFKIYLRLVIF